MEEIFEIRSCIEILANDIKVNTMIRLLSFYTILNEHKWDLMQTKSDHPTSFSKC